MTPDEAPYLLTRKEAARRYGMTVRGWRNTTERTRASRWCGWDGAMSRFTANALIADAQE